MEWIEWGARSVAYNERAPFFLETVCSRHGDAVVPYRLTNRQC